jgi:hypothetical protein
MARRERGEVFQISPKSAWFMQLPRFVGIGGVNHALSTWAVTQITDHDVDFGAWIGYLLILRLL